MPSYLDFDSTKNFRDFVLGKTLQVPNGPQSFNNTNYSEQSQRVMANVDPGSVDMNRNSDLLQPQTSNTYKPEEFFITENLDTLPRRANLGLYPTNYTPPDYSMVGIMSSTGYDTETELFKFAVDNMKNNPNGPVLSRISRNIDTAINGKVRLLDALNGNTSTAINILTGREPLVESNYKITVAKTLAGKAVDFLETAAGVTAPFSEIPGSYLSDPSNPINVRPTATTQAGALWQDVTGALGSLVGIQRRPKLDRKPSDLMIEYMGEGQKMRLYDLLSFSKYAPNYTTTARSQNTSKIFNFVDKVAQGVKNILGMEAPTGGAYIGDDRGNDVKFAMNDFNDRPIRSSYYLSLMFDEVSAKLFQRTKNIGEGGSPKGNLTWISKNSSPKITDESVSTNFKFRDNSILSVTQEILDSSPGGGAGRSHVANAIDQTSRVFQDGDVRISRGSAVKYVKKTSGEESGAEFARVWTKDKPYLNYGNTMKRTANVRKFDSSVMGGKSRPWNLNYAPMSNGKKSFEDSTNIFKDKGGNFYAQKYMFSIENLAWKTSNIPGFTYNDLPACERGNNGGRVMWFPPYDLKMSEQNNAKWETNTFLGRPEPIYTYQNTERTGQVSFKVVVDHPSIMNLLIREHFKGMSDEEADNYINAFFAGAEEIDFYELIKTYTTLDKDDISLMKQYLNAGKNPEVIKKMKYVSESSTISNPATDSKKDSTTVKFPITTYYFPNDTPGGSKNGTTTSETYSDIYKKYINSKDVYLTSLTGATQTLLNSSGKVFDEDRTLLFGSKTIAAGEIAGKIEDTRKTIDDAFTKLTTDFNTYTTALTTAKTDIKSKTVKVLKFSIRTATSAVADDNYNYFLGVRRCYSIYTDILKNLSETMPKVKWATDSNISSMSSTGFAYPVSYTFKELGFDGIEGEVQFILGTTGENTNLPNNPLNKTIDCHKDVKSSKGLKVYSTNAFFCREGSVGFAYSKSNEIPGKPAENISLSKGHFEPDGETVVPNPKPNIDVMKRIIAKTLGECFYFKKLEDDSPLAFNSLREKLKYFHPGFHSTTPEGLNARLTFLLQCVRPGDTIPIKGKSDNTDIGARNTTFGPPPICVLRIGDFYHSKIVIKDVNITYDDTTWDLNPEGIGIQPMIATVTLQINFIGGQGLERPVDRLQNALSSNFFANTEMYDERAESTNSFIGGQKASEFTKEFLEDLQKRAKLDLDAKSDEPNSNISLDQYIGSVSKTGLSYTSYINDLPTKIQSYFSLYQDTYNKLKKKYSSTMVPLLMSSNFRTISGCTIQNETGDDTIELFGEYPKGEDLSFLVTNVALIQIKNVINTSDMVTMFGFDFLEPNLKDSTNTNIRSFLVKLVDEKLTPMITDASLSKLQKARIDLVTIIDKLNYITKYGNDGKILGTTYTASSLSGFTKSDFYGEYSNMIDYLKSQHVRLTITVGPMNKNSYETLDLLMVKFILKVLLNDKVKDFVDNCKNNGSFNDDNGDGVSAQAAQMDQVLKSFILEPTDDIIALDKFPIRKNDKEISFAIGTTADIVEGTTGAKEELREIFRDKNKLGTTLNFYK